MRVRRSRSTMSTALHGSGRRAHAGGSDAHLIVRRAHVTAATRTRSYDARIWVKDART